METLEQIATKLHQEARKVWPNLTGLRRQHDHSFAHCRHKQWFLQMAAAFLPLLQAKQEAEEQQKQARGLLWRVVAGACDWYRLTAAQRDNQTAIAQDAAADLRQALEAAASAGCVLERNEHGNWIGRNKLAEGKPTRIIKLPNMNFYTMEIVKIDGKALISPISVTSESVPDATGDSEPARGTEEWRDMCTSRDPMGD